MLHKDASQKREKSVPILAPKMDNRQSRTIKKKFKNTQSHVFKKNTDDTTEPTEDRS